MAPAGAVIGRRSRGAPAPRRPPATPPFPIRHSTADQASSTGECVLLASRHHDRSSASTCTRRGEPADSAQGYPREYSGQSQRSGLRAWHAELAAAPAAASASSAPVSRRAARLHASPCCSAPCSWWPLQRMRSSPLRPPCPRPAHPAVCPHLASPEAGPSPGTIKWGQAGRQAEVGSSGQAGGGPHSARASGRQGGLAGGGGCALGTAALGARGFPCRRPALSGAGKKIGIQPQPSPPHPPPHPQHTPSPCSSNPPT